MNLMSIVQKVEGLPIPERALIIESILKELHYNYEFHTYESGKNIFVKIEPAEPSPDKKYIGVSCHFDVVPLSPGANDNGSAIAVAIEMLRRMKEHRFKNFGVIVFFFDQEEIQSDGIGLKGSTAWVKKYGISEISGLLNLEMLGMGDKFALWSLNENSKGKALNTFEEVLAEEKIFVKRFDKIVTNIADHISFREAGLEDSFSITCISDKELELARVFYQAMNNQATKEQLQAIMRQAPLFVHYHKPTDKSEHLNENSLQLAATMVWKTLLRLDSK
jgi:hypothetical protein